MISVFCRTISATVTLAIPPNAHELRRADLKVCGDNPDCQGKSTPTDGPSKERNESTQASNLPVVNSSSPKDVYASPRKKIFLSHIRRLSALPGAQGRALRAASYAQP